MNGSRRFQEYNMYKIIPPGRKKVLIKKEASTSFVLVNFVLSRFRCSQPTGTWLDFLFIFTASAARCHAYHASERKSKNNQPDEREGNAQKLDLLSVWGFLVSHRLKRLCS